HGYSSNPGSVFGESSTGRPSSPWPYDIQGCLEDCAFSLCGANGAVDISTITEEQFNERRVSFEQFCNDPLLTAERQDLIMRINGRYYPRSVADAMLMSMIYFQKPLSEEKVNKLMEDYKRKQNLTSKSAHSPAGGWFSWSRKGSSADADLKEDTAAVASAHNAEAVDQKSTQELHTRSKTAPMSIQRPSPLKSTTPPMPVVVDMDEKGSETETEAEELGGQRQRFMRSLRLPSDALKALGLRKGMNEVRFSVTTKFQGTSWCMCHIYLWDWCDKIVISDIDGTITKSDVLGHIMPVIGGTWTHNGVAELYTGIKNNGSVFICQYSVISS
uniref:LNS2/PITP domain-containing protein n=1 Tax=Plectus sambesii TaxID=2011161 RepID=A0A914UJ74_9BILA